MVLVFEAPANPGCGTCPYRRDVPSGVWAREEYAKLPGYDAETPFQPPQVFGCHQLNGKVCGGWAGVHGRQGRGRELMAVRMGLLVGALTAEVAEAIETYESLVPLWSSGLAAAEHGMAEVDAPGRRARREIDRLTVKRQRRGRQ